MTASAEPGRPTSTLENNFDFASREAALYEMWEQAGCFRPEAASSPTAPVFNISMPPPNANGELHLGHAFGYTVMDILGRFYRLNGHRVLLLPGKDHAGIQTQVVYEKKLKSDGIDPKAKDTQELYDACYEFCLDRAQYMRAQEKTLGLSADWSRELFTLDPRLNRIVFETFEKLWKDGLIYKGHRIVNWSVFSQTSISDVEVEYKEQQGSLWYICYPLVGGPQPGVKMKLPGGGEFTIGAPGIVTATTRPETMLGDTALAVHPEDERYKDLVGREVLVPLTGRKVPVIADIRVDREYGTGVIKVTPAHDFLDYDMGVEHKLEVIQVIGKDGLMTAEAGKDFAGMKIATCRDAVVEKLRAAELLLDITSMMHKVPIGERGKDIIEPLVSEQWFVAVDKPGNSLKQKALELVRSGRIKVYPARCQSMLEQWFENLRDWNISRQLWWGHRLPVWYRDASGKEEIYVGANPPQGSDWRQESDVFDTWFSSGQWAFSTVAALGLVDIGNSSSRSEYFPTHTMVMGRDILFFWACRMLLLTAYRMHDIPWQHIFFTGLIRDEHGQKMSKSKGNGIEPDDMIRKFGSDALRLALVMGASPGNDLNFSERKIDGYSKFINKLWNAARLLEMKLAELPAPQRAGTRPITLKANRWILNELQGVHLAVTSKLLEYEVSIAADELYRFTWTVFCDWYLEMMKSLVDKGSPEWREETYFTARLVFETILTMLHPFIPFVTEELAQKLPLVRGERPLAVHDWSFGFELEQFNNAEIAAAMEAVSAVRSVKAALGIPHKRIRVALSREFDAELTMLVSDLARADFCSSSEIPEALALRRPFSAGTITCEVEGKERYKERLVKDIAQNRKLSADLEAKLSGAFALNAKPELVEKERDRLAQVHTALAQLEQELGYLD